MPRITVAVEQEMFNRRLKRFIKESNLGTDVVLKKTAFDLLKNILKPIPFGTHPVDSGRARAGWYASMKGLGLSESLSTRIKNKSEVELGKREGSFKARLGEFTTDKSIEMVNSVNYILFLEYGSSKQAPFGMVRISMRKMRVKFMTDLKRGIVSKW